VKTLGLNILTISLAAAFFHVSALAQGSRSFICRPVEFAELVAINKSDRAKIYCEYKSNDENNHGMYESIIKDSIDWLSRGQRSDAARTKAEAARYAEERDTCRYESARVLRVITMAGETVARCD